MLRFFYNPKYKYTNRTIIDLTGDTNYVDKDYANIDSPDTINGHIIYQLNGVETIPTYILDLDNTRRYFVSGITQLRSGKYQISLLRDMISEHPELWKNEEAYINAGLATDFNKYKRWDLPFTNTKLSEQRLDINGKSSFFVYYVNTQHINDNVLTEDDLKISSSSVPGITGYDYRISNLNEIPEFNLVNAGQFSTWTRTRGVLRWVSGGVTGNGYTVVNSSNANGADFTFDSQVSSNNNFNIGSVYNFGKKPEAVVNSDNVLRIDMYIIRFTNNENGTRTLMRDQLLQVLNDYQNNNFGTVVDLSRVNNLDAYVDKIIYNENDNKVYTIRRNRTTQTHYENIPQSNYSNLINVIRQWDLPYGRSSSSIPPAPIPSFIQQYGDYIRFESTRQINNYTLVELGTATSFEFNFIANQRKLPRSAVRCVNIVSGENGITDDDIAQSLMLAQTNGINATGATGRILDIQYLPFSVATTTNENIKINNLPMIAQFLDTDDYEYVTDLPDLTNINKETDTIKIVSPSRSSQFLFRPYNNDGIMLFNTKITLKPYNSVIYVRPSTQGLLLQDFNDKDCLMIIEDFSLTNVSSEWTNYIYQNRNYQNAFEREIQGREFERGWERRIEQAQAKSDEWAARNISAQKAQTYTGNLPIISSIAGAVGTAWQDSTYMEMAKLDREYNEALYQEGLSLSRDQFNMQLDNIQAQPNIPSRVTTIDIKLLDGIYLEFYSTNPTELDAINNFYRYNGNRIDAYGTFSAYWGWFVRGKIILSQFYTQPEIDELNRRLSMGIFTEVQYGN